MTHVATAPFGARRLTLAQVAAQATAEACPPEAGVDKWRILKAVTEARTRLGISDRAAAVLGALLSFHPGDEIAAGAIVFPSNRVLSLRAHGMSAPTLRRHIGALVEAGLVVRRDSPNGKRYARKGEDGAIALAFGFELTPLVARVAEFEAVVAEIRAEARECATLRERITILRRDLDKTIALLAETDADFDAEAVLAGLGGAIGTPLRGLDVEALGEIAYRLGLARADLDKRLTRLVKTENPSANDVQNERHRQNSNPTPLLDSEPSFEKERADAAEPATESAAAVRLDLPAILAACPDLRDWAGQPIRSWDDLVRAAETVRPALGVSPDAWADAVAAMGRSGAAVTVATILQRAADIRSPGGYLRSLTERARGGRFSPAPIVVSLLRKRARDGIGAAAGTRMGAGPS